MHVRLETLGRRQAVSLWLAFLILLTLSLPATADPLVLGVFEQPQCKQESTRSARLLFAKTGDRWVALNNQYEFSENRHLTLPSWTIVLDGRNLGNLKLRDPNPASPTLKDWYYGRDKLYVPENPEKVPTVKNESKSFGGWCQAPEARPLVLVSRANFDDPEKWKPFSPDQSYKQSLYLPLKLVVGRFNAIHCIEGADHSEPWDFKPEDLVLYKGYRSAFGKELVSIGIDLTKIGCDSIVEPQWSNHWFLFDGEKIEFIGNQMELVDSGDYDNDGRSELLFWYSGYNRDGYVLIYDDLRQKVEYLWGYH
ncbi:MAG: hypothetical protein EPO06_00460 [Burkholderiaceae bacterium]|nr:MAG: hypothetical protein EPO06_00460 [Burkholderiaceae bacterium]